MSKQLQKKMHLTSFQVIILGFAGVIFMGALFLMLPISSKSGCITPFHEALFTSTSAVCVTGLVVQDTATYWSMFGQIILLILIQIGGLGVITVAAAFALLSGRKIWGKDILDFCHPFCLRGSETSQRSLRKGKGC